MPPGSFRVLNVATAVNRHQSVVITPTEYTTTSTNTAVLGTPGLEYQFPGYVDANRSTPSAASNAPPTAAAR